MFDKIRFSYPTKSAKLNVKERNEGLLIPGILFT